MSRYAPIARGAMTGKVLAHLIAQLEPGVLVGRGSAPKAGGWENGQPSSGKFKPYTVLRARSATTPASGEPNPLGRNLASWMLAYRLNCYGALESQASDVCDQVSEAISTLSGTFTLRNVSWTLQQVIFGGMGDVLPNNATDPPYWQTAVDVSLHLSRERTR